MLNIVQELQYSFGIQCMRIMLYEFTDFSEFGIDLSRIDCVLNFEIDDRELKLY